MENFFIITKTKTDAGDLAKIYTVHTNKYIVFHKLILSKQKIKGLKVITKRFGKYVLYERFSFKIDTYYSINKQMFSHLNKQAKSYIDKQKK